MNPIPIEISEFLFKSRFPFKKNVTPSDVRMTDISVHSMTRPKTAENICRFIKSQMGTSDVIVTDTFSNIGGMAIALARHFKEVNVCELDPLHCKYLEHNLKVYEVYDKCRVHCGDSLKIIHRLKQEVVFLDPPWGGVDYKEKKKFHFPLLNGSVHVGEFIRNIMKIPSVKMTILLCPHNLDIEDIQVYLKIGFWTHIVDPKRGIFILVCRNS